MKISGVRNRRFSREPAVFSESGVFDTMKWDFWHRYLTSKNIRGFLESSAWALLGPHLGQLCARMPLCAPGAPAHKIGRFTPNTLHFSFVCPWSARTRGGFFRGGPRTHFSSRLLLGTRAREAFRACFSGNSCARIPWDTQGHGSTRGTVLRSSLAVHSETTVLVAHSGRTASPFIPAGIGELQWGK